MYISGDAWGLPIPLQPSENQGGSAQHLTGQFRGLGSDLSHSVGHSPLLLFSAILTLGQKNVLCNMY